MIDSDLGEPGGYGSQTAELLVEGGIEVVDVEGIPTVALEDALAIVTAVNTDIGNSEVGWLSYALVPVDEAVRAANRETSERSRVDFNAQQAVRMVGKSFADYLAHEEGFLDYDAYDKDKYPHSGIGGEFVQPSEEEMMYYGIPDGKFYYALDGLGRRKEVDMNDVREGIPGIEDDEVMQAYFELMCEQFRVDLKCAFEVLDPTFVLAFGASDKKMRLGADVVNAMSRFLEQNGYDRNFSKVSFIEAGQPDGTES